MRALGPTSTRQPDPWRARAACRPGDMDLTGSAKEQRLAVERICRGRACPVVADCFAEGVASHGVGVWGATTQAEREEAKLQPTERDECGTHAGYWRHSRAKEPQCVLCLEARAAYKQAQRAG